MFEALEDGDYMIAGRREWLGAGDVVYTYADLALDKRALDILVDLVIGKLGDDSKPLT